jgi:transmembrane sensor
MNTQLLSKEEINELIIKFLSGEINPDEKVILFNWVKQSDENKHYFVINRDIWMASAQITAAGKMETERALEKINQEIGYGNTSGVNSNRENIKIIQKTGSVFSRYLKIAALWILLFSLGAVVSRLIMKPSWSAGNTSDITIIAPMGSKALTFLPDGSKVWLNAGSKIVYSIEGQNNEREVILTGEAYFDVAKEIDRPFVVEAQGLLVRVYGTEFNVKAYPEERVVETTLVEGSISVTVKDKPSDIVTLNPNQQVSYFKATEDRGESLVVTRGIDPARYTLWINDKLQITGETLGSLAVMLERKYDVRIYFEVPQLKELRFTGYIEKETIEQVLEMIKISSSVDYRMEEREIWLRNK